MRGVRGFLILLCFVIALGQAILPEAYGSKLIREESTELQLTSRAFSADTTFILSNNTVKENSRDSSKVGVLRPGRQVKNVKLPYFLMDDAVGRFAIAQDSILIVRRSQKIDYENQKSHSIEIGIQTETGDTLSKNFIVQVEDVNEPPEDIFLSNRRIPEHNRDSSIVGALNVTEPDSADRTQLQLINNAEGRFYIEDRKLKITDTARFNHEKEPEVRIMVRAADRYGADLKMPLTVRIMDRNDSPTGVLVTPRHIQENADPGTLIGKLIAVDEDSADRHQFSLASTSDPVIVRDSLLFFEKGGKLDHETKPVLSFKVQVRDADGSTHIEPVKVEVRNVNEPPEIHSEPLIVMDEDKRVNFYVRFEDPEYPEQDINVSFQSDNPGLISRKQLTVRERGVRRLLRIQPRPDSNGVANIKARVMDGEFVDSTSFTIRVRPVNDAPYLVRNIKRRLDEGARLLIDEHTLRVRDVDDRPSKIIYEVGVQAKYGQLEFKGENKTSSFTQADLNQDRLWYQHNGSEHHQDTVQLAVKDSKGAEIRGITLPFDIVPINDPPQISQVDDQLILEDHSTDVLPFTIKDVETAGINLEVEKHSSIDQLIPEDSIHITGIDRFRSVKAIPVPNGYGHSEITLSVNDGVDTTTTQFQVNVKPVNDSPIISAPDTLIIKEDVTAGPVDIRFRDEETKTSNLKWAIISTNEQLINQEGIQLRGGGEQKRLYLTSRPNQFGRGSLIMRLTDGELADTVRTYLTVKPVNDPPGEFSLFNSNLNQNDDSLKVDFKWEKARDVDNRGVQYVLHIKGSALDTTIKDIEENSFTMKGKSKLKPNAEYEWWVKATDGTDTTKSSSVKQFLTPNFDPVPKEFKLYSNFPNPFNPVTNIRYKIPTKSKVRVSVYDMSGRMISQLVNTVQTSGEYKVSWNAGDRASGIYVCRIVASGLNNSQRYVETKKMMLVK